ncbi:MAG: sugar kinase [Moorea sp. SIO2B7]|nr:sugar kinase [Moorena sp. SIO2B7]
MKYQGLFVGLVSLDIIYRVDTFPGKNQKIVASDETIAAGGPATNAAVTFSYLGGKGNLVGVVGNHPISNLIRGELERFNLTISDLNPDGAESPPVSSIIVTKATGDRAVISINATKYQACGSQYPLHVLEDIDIVLIDGHQMEVSQAIAEKAKQQNIPVVIDGGSWKNGFETVLPYVDYAVCSANFYPPDCETQENVFAYLSAAGIKYIAITNGEKSIQYLSQGKKGQLNIPAINAIDTLGAGDIFHGAFCYYVLQQNFIDSLTVATKIAAYSCQFFGSRKWMED